jgi:hypothetical protein
MGKKDATTFTFELSVVLAGALLELAITTSGTITAIADAIAIPITIFLSNNPVYCY